VCADGAGTATEFASGEAAYWEAMRMLAMARVDGGLKLAEAVLAEKGVLGESAVLISRTRDEGLPGCVRKLRGAGLSVVVVALATHTYRAPPGTGGMAQNREAEFLRVVDRLEAAGAALRVVSHPRGAAGLSGGSRKRRAV
jgi:hypothetical protein